MIETTPRLLAALQCVTDAGGTLTPSWDATAARGVRYAAGALDDAVLLPDLERLAADEYLERVFIDRLSLCPSCGSAALNVREICIECHGSQLVASQLLVHYRCAFVGPDRMFAQEAGGRRCPKCRRLLRDLGTDHGRQGDCFTCRTCNAAFQVPDVGGLCLSCGGRFPGDQLTRIRPLDIFAYRLTALGREALSQGRLLEPELALRPLRDGAIRRRESLLELIDDECRRRRALRTTFGLIVFEQPEGGDDDAVSARVRPLLAESDQIGRLNDRRLVAVLPGATKRRARATLERIRALPIAAAIVEGIDTPEILNRLDQFAP